MVIDPRETFVLAELERIRWFLGQLDLTVDDVAGIHIQDTYTAVSDVIRQLKYARRETK